MPESLVRNHGIIYGTKRIGSLAVVVFCAFNDIDLDAPGDDTYDLVVGIAFGPHELAHAAALLRTWQLQVELPGFPHCAQDATAPDAETRRASEQK